MSIPSSGLAARLVRKNLLQGTVRRRRPLKALREREEALCVREERLSELEGALQEGEEGLCGRMKVVPARAESLRAAPCCEEIHAPSPHIFVSNDTHPADVSRTVDVVLTVDPSLHVQWVLSELHRKLTCILYVSCLLRRY